MFAEGGDLCGQSRIDQRQSIFVAKQVNRIFRYTKTLDLCLPRPPKHGCRKYAGRERDQGVWDFVEKRDDPANQARRPRQRSCPVRICHASPSSARPLIMAIASREKSAARFFARSKSAPAATAAPAASPSEFLSARISRKIRSPEDRRRTSTSYSGRTISASSPCQSPTGTGSTAPEFIAKIVTIG